MCSTVTDETFIDEMIQDVRDEICHPANAGKVCVAVEGDDDISLYGKFMNDKQMFFFTTGDCVYIVPVLEQLPEYRDQLIGIKDADFDHLRGITYLLPNLFLTDTHDAETMMLQQGQLISDLVYEYTHKQIPDIMDEAFAALEWYSYLQYFNTDQITAVNADGIRFKGLSISNVFDGMNYVGCTDCVSIVKGYADNARLAHFPTDVQLAKFKAAKATIDMYNLHRGHDVVRCLGIIIRKNTPTSNKMVGDDVIPRVLRIRYQMSDFQSTRLFHDLDSWASVRGWNLWN